MKIAGRASRPIWPADEAAVEVIDQTKLPFALSTLRLESAEAAERAIREMNVRGAPLIGATAAYGVALAMRTDPSDENLDRVYVLLLAARPTAVNLRWALDRMRAVLRNQPRGERAAIAWAAAATICDED